MKKINQQIQQDQHKNFPLLLDNMEWDSNSIVDDIAIQQSKIRDYINSHDFNCPTLVLNLEIVRNNYRKLKKGLEETHIHYAVKANPHPQIIRTLYEEGCAFDAASRGEIELCLSCGVNPTDISFGNTIKKPEDIAFAYQSGVRLFAADAEEEVIKLSENAIGSRVFIRVLVENSEADWPLSRKFGCSPSTVPKLIAEAKLNGLDPVGISFHVGSQTRDPKMWDVVLDQIANIWKTAKKCGHDLSLLNIGGGFPAFYGGKKLCHQRYGKEILDKVRKRFGFVPTIIAEPGRSLVAEAGMISAKVLLVSKKSQQDECRWVYFDIGKFSGLAETIDEAIHYQFETMYVGSKSGPCIIAGPSCDSADILYEKTPVFLPLKLTAGDRIVIKTAGAYTTTYSSVSFNGFPPLDTVLI